MGYLSAHIGTVRELSGEEWAICPEAAGKFCVGSTRSRTDCERDGVGIKEEYLSRVSHFSGLLAFAFCASSISLDLDSGFISISKWLLADLTLFTHMDSLA